MVRKKKSLIYGVISLPAIGMMPDPSLTNFGWNKFGGFNYIFESVFKGNTTVLWRYFLSIAPSWTLQWPQEKIYFHPLTVSHGTALPEEHSRAPAPWRKPFGIFSLPQPAMIVWDVQELPGFLSNYSFFKCPGNVFFALPVAWQRAAQVLYLEESAVALLESKDQDIPSCFLIFFHFVPQLPDMFSCYLFLIHNIKCVGEKKNKII